MSDPISFQIIRSRRKTAAIQLTPQGAVLLRCPMKTTAAEARRFIDAHEGWIRSHLQQLEPLPPPLTAAGLAALTADAGSYFPARTAFWAAEMGLSYGRITVRHQRSRWGSCTSAGNLSFNCLLMLTPPEIRDYVIIHELCHRIEMNHSPAFWAQVERFCPDWRRRRSWLRDRGGALISRLPR